MPHRKDHKIRVEGLLGRSPQGLLPPSYVFPSIADTEFVAESGRFGRTDPTTQLGLDWFWDTKGKDTQIFDTGEPFDTAPWDTRGRTYGEGTWPEGTNTGDSWAQEVIDDRTDDPYTDGKAWFDHQESLGNLREGLTFAEWQKDMRELGGKKLLVMYAQSNNPLNPATWTHEFGHVGQFILRASGINIDKIKASKTWSESSVEDKQRLRDIMMSSPGQPSYERGVDYLKKKEQDDQGNWIPYTKKEIRDIAEDAILEAELANQALESRWGFTLPHGSLSQYESEHMPGIWDRLRKRISVLMGRLGYN